MAADKIGGKVVETTENWQEDFDYNFLGHWDIPEGDKGIDVSIEKVETRTGAKVAGKTQTVILVYFKEKNLTAGGKPMILNKENSNILTVLFRSSKKKTWEGKRVTLYSKFIETRIYIGFALRFKDKAPTGSTAPVQKQELDVSSPNFEQIKEWLAKDNNKLSSVVSKYEVTPAALEVLKTIKSE